VHAQPGSAPVLPPAPVIEDDEGAAGGKAAAPSARAPDSDVHPPAGRPDPAAVEELPPMPMPVPGLGFSNPFRQYSGGKIPHWEYGGSSVLSNDYLSLTPSTTNQLGFIWSEEPVFLPEWEAEIEFHIGGHQHRGAGGGLAFWFTTQQGRKGALYGHDERFTGLGVFFDTYEDDESADPAKGLLQKTEPFVVALVNDGEDVGKLMESSDAGQEAIDDNQVGVCFAAYRNLRSISRARIVWQHKVLRVWLDLAHTGQYQQCVHTEITDARVHLPEAGYFGVSASTGAFADTHSLYSIKVANLTQKADVEPISIVPGAQSTGVLDPDLQVHAEADPHAHVKLHAEQMRGRAAEDAAMNDAEQQASHETPVPPTQSNDEVISHLTTELVAVEEALWELFTHAQQHAEQQNKTVAHVEDVVERLQAFEEHIDGVHKLIFKHLPPASTLLESLDARDPSAALRQISEGVTALQASASSSSSNREVSARHDAVIKAVNGVAAKASQENSETVKRLSELERSVAALSKAVEEQSSGGWVFPLLVCGQMLVVSVVVLMRAGSSKRSHLP